MCIRDSYTIDATSIARELGLGNRTNTILQAAFFKLTGVIPVDQAVTEMKDAIYKTYFKKKGQAVVDIDVYKRQMFFSLPGFT